MAPNDLQTDTPEAQLLPAAQLLDEALAQDDRNLRLDELCPSSSGSASYSSDTGLKFRVEGPTFALPEKLARAPPTLQLKQLKEQQQQAQTTAAATTSTTEDPSQPLQQPPSPSSSSTSFVREGVLPEIQHVWRSVNSELHLWRYAGKGSKEVLTYEGVSQQILCVTLARPRAFVTGVDWFLVIATTVDVSLHALCVDPRSGQLFPPVQTQHRVSTDDTLISTMTSDPASGRIFLGGLDGSLSELQYFGDELSWSGQPKKCRRISVQSSVLAMFPALLRKISEKLFGQADGVEQLVVDPIRSLLLALSSNSTISIFKLPMNKKSPDGRIEEPAITFLCSVDKLRLTGELSKMRSRLFPGLAPQSGSILGNFGAAAASAVGGAMGGAVGGTVAGVAAASQGTKLKIVKLLPLGYSYGANIVVCAVAEDGTRFFLRGVFKTERQQNQSGQPLGAGSGAGAAGGGPDPATSITFASQYYKTKAVMTQVVVHHVRFLDVNSPIVKVKDAAYVSGSTLLVCNVVGADSPSLFPCTAKVWEGTAPPAVSSTTSSTAPDSAAPTSSSSSSSPAPSDIIIAISQDLRVLAQQQSQTRSPWLGTSGGFYEHVEVVRLPTSSSSASSSTAPPPSAPSTGPSFRTLALAASALPVPAPILEMYGRPAQQALVLPTLALSELALQQLTTPQQLSLVTSVGVFTLAKVRPIDDLSQLLLSGDLQSIKQFVAAYTGEQTCALGFQLLASAVAKPEGETVPEAAQRSRNLHRTPIFRPLDAQEEALLLRSEQLLLTPQLAHQLGFVQKWPSMDSNKKPPSSGFGHAMATTGGSAVSARLRGLALYLSRIVRPIWLQPVMEVTWGKASAADATKRKAPSIGAGDWWPPPPAPAPKVPGSKWKLSLSKPQRSLIQQELQQLRTILDRAKDTLAQEDQQHPGQQRGSSQAESLLLLVATSIETLAFLELVAPRVELLSSASCPPDDLILFANMPFRDLVCRGESRMVFRKLMQGGIVACQQLHAKCPRLFSRVDLEIQEANEMLEAIRRGSQVELPPGTAPGPGDWARWGQLLQGPLRTLEHHAARVDLTEVAARLRSIGACKGLVSLATRVARARDPRDEALHVQDPHGPRAQQLHYARLECYQAVIVVLDDLLSLARQASPDALWLPDSGARGSEDSFGTMRAADLPDLLPTPMRAGDAAMYLNAMLCLCLEDHAHRADALFHFCILKWLLQRDIPLWRYDSPYLKNFLQTHAQDQPVLLCRYYQHRHRWAEACDAYMALARRAGPHQTQLPYAERVALLQSAALCARMPDSNRRVELVLQRIEQLKREEGRLGQEELFQPQFPDPFLARR